METTVTVYDLFTYSFMCLFDGDRTEMDTWEWRKTQYLNSFFDYMDLR